MIKIPVEVGDIILSGRFRNKRLEVKEIGEDEWGHPTINGKSILKFRIQKLMDKKVNNMLSNEIRKVAADLVNEIKNSTENWEVV